MTAKRPRRHIRQSEDLRRSFMANLPSAVGGRPDDPVTRRRLPMIPEDRPAEMSPKAVGRFTTPARAVYGDLLSHERLRVPSPRACGLRGSLRAARLWLAPLERCGAVRDWSPRGTAGPRRRR